ncbi:hypothetical protein B5C02_06780 [Staphylococcus pseudintermedius]|nr:hypothetical protein B5C02_06780 [Staphylococcus pseudintermedius]
MDETPEGTVDPENPPTLTTIVTVKSKRWLVEGSALGTRVQDGNSMQVTCSKRSVCMWSVQKGMHAYDMFKKSKHNHQMNLDINHQKCYNMSYEN